VLFVALTCAVACGTTVAITPPGSSLGIDGGLTPLPDGAYLSGDGAVVIKLEDGGTVTVPPPDASSDSWRPLPVPRHPVIFVTNGTWNGLTTAGLQELDNHCQQAGMRLSSSKTGDKFIAWATADGAIAPQSRLKPSASGIAFYSPSGVKILDTVDQLSAGTPPTLDETEVAGEKLLLPIDFWTGFSGAGGGPSDCHQWTTNQDIYFGGSGEIRDCASVQCNNGEWTLYEAKDCSYLLHLLCIQSDPNP
jgi:hypothetical protein